MEGCVFSAILLFFQSFITATKVLVERSLDCDNVLELIEIQLTTLTFAVLAASGNSWVPADGLVRCRHGSNIRD